MRAIVGATVNDGRGGDPLREAVVVVDGGLIAGVGTSGAPAEAEVIDGRGLWLMPGLIDCHVHLGGTRTPNPMLHAWVPHGLAVARAVGDAGKLVDAGFTTVRDLSSIEALAIRDAIAEGAIRGPRIVAAGRYIEPTGGADDPSFMPLEWSRHVNTPRMADGPDGVRRAVREQLREGSDFIKTCTTGAAMVHARSRIDILEWSDEEIAALIDEAHRKGVRAAAHAHAAEGVQQAVRYGVDTIEHGTLMDAESARMMADAGTFLVPTFFQMHQLANEGEKYGTPDYVLEKARRLDAAHNETFRHVLEYGVKVAMGTDCTGTPVGPHGPNARELEFLVAAGMSTRDAVRSITSIAAEAIGLAAEVGTVESGKQADLVLVGGDPYSDVRAVQDVRWVMQGGEVVVDRR